MQRRDYYFAARSLGPLAATLLVYFLYSRRRSRKQEFGLLHLVEKAVNRKLTSRTLEDELVSDAVDSLFSEALRDILRISGRHRNKAE